MTERRCIFDTVLSLADIESRSQRSLGGNLCGAILIQKQYDIQGSQKKHYNDLKILSVNPPSLINSADKLILTYYSG